ncbi:MAG: endopeptidase La, partial [Clostridia bacterium]|nr:endopeptidase La [Clostridia bacterium]
VSEVAIRSVLTVYTREGGVRGLKKRMDTLCRSAAVRIVRGEKDQLHITPENLREYLDMRPVHHRSVRENNVPGIVTGLAWTAAGGDILYIETMFTKGNGQIVITGQLGDVMKESARLAISLVKHRYPDKAGIFEEHDLHIHVPDGATPKDGPSAGITLTTAIASLVTGTPVKSTIAMTGEISLRGEVTPIGGLPEKLMAAQRAGVKQVLIPSDNEDDLQDVAKEVLEQLEIIPVRNLSEAFCVCGIEDPEPAAKAV